VPPKKVLDAIYEDAGEMANSLPEDSKLQELSDLLKVYFDAEKQKKDLEVQLKETGTILQRMLREFIPESMAMLGVDSVTTSEGLKVSVIQAVYARLNKQDQLRGFNWLKKHGLDGIIKNQIVVNVDKKDEGQTKVLDKLLSTLDKHGFTYNIDEKVHAATLQAAIRDEILQEQSLMAQGKKIPASKRVPTDLFNVFVGREAKIDMKSAKKAGLI